MASLRLADLAQALRVDISTVSRWERGLVEPDGTARILYAAFLRRLDPFNNDAPPGGTSGASHKTEDGGLDGAGYPG